MIHSEIGCKAIAAKVNMKLVPLSYVLKTGDQVEIISAEDESPKSEWLEFLQTRHAKNLVLDYFRPQKDFFINKGTEELKERFKEMGRTFNEQNARQIAADLELNNAEEFLYRYGIGYVKFNDISDIISGKPRKSKDFIINSSEDGHKYVIAGCCHPIPGDPVIGFLSPDGTITVHKKSCSVAENMATKHGDLIVKTPGISLCSVDSWSYDFNRIYDQAQQCAGIVRFRCSAVPREKHKGQDRRSHPCIHKPYIPRTRNYCLIV